jgi:hypothetical protein
MQPLGALCNVKRPNEVVVRPGTGRQAVPAYTEMMMRFGHHRNTADQGTIASSNTVGSQTLEIGSAEATKFGRIAGWWFEVCKSEVAVEQSNVKWPTEETRNDVDLAESRIVRPGNCASNPAHGDGEVGGSARVRGLRLVSPGPSHGVVNGWAGAVARSHQQVAGPCLPRLRGSPSSH